MKIVDGYYELPTDKRARELGYFRDDRLPNLIIEFLEGLKILSDDFSGKSGRSFKLTEWQRAAIKTGYSWRKPTNTLRFSEFIWFVPRRQGKSILVSGLSAIHAMKDKRGEIYVIASTKKQADVIYNYCLSFMESDKDLEKRFHPVPSHQEIEDTVSKSKISVFSINNVGKSGTNTSLLIFEENQEYPDCYSRSTYDRLTPSLGSRANSIIICIGTAGDSRESLSYSLFKRGQDILDGKSEDLHTFPIIYSLPFDEDWTDRNNWKKTLPNYGYTVSEDFYEQKYMLTKDNPYAENSFRKQYLNQFVGSVETWLPNNIIDGCKKQFVESAFHGKTSILSLDLGSCHDMTCLAHTIKDDDGIYWFLPHYFMPEKVAKENGEKYGHPYMSWANAGHLTLTPGNTVDTDYVLEKIKKDKETYTIEKCFFDKTKLEFVRQQISKMGIETIEHSQGVQAMSPGYQMLDRLFREGKVRWCHPIFQWNLENARPYMKGTEKDLLMIQKSSDRALVDGIDCFAMSLAYWIQGQETKNQPPEGQSWAMLW